jgi:phosphoribosylglycinamide formyltransferase 1
LSAAEAARVVVLISGRGSNMRALAERSADPEMGYQVAAVLSDRPQAAGLELASALGIPARAVIPDPAAPRAAYEAVLAAAIEEFAPAVIVLAGFMRILSAPLVARYTGRILNIHPSLLPKYPGLDTHRRVLAARESEHGATVHFVTEQLDAGPLIIQGRVHVDAGDDAQRLQARVHVIEHRIYPLAVRWYCSGRLRYGEGRAWLDGKPLSAPVQYDAIEVH